MRKAGVYLNGVRFEVKRLAFVAVRDVPRRRRRRVVPGLPDVRVSGRVTAQPGFRAGPLLRRPYEPVTVRYKNVSGPFYLDAGITTRKDGSVVVDFEGFAAGPLKVKPHRWTLTDRESRRLNLSRAGAI